MKASLIASVAVAIGTSVRAEDPLPSWNDGPTKQAIVRFVTDVTTEGGPYFVPRAERIAVFDNDGTLWCEQPMYPQMAFNMDRVREEAARHPEWRDRQPFKAVLEDDLKGVAASSVHGLVEMTAVPILFGPAVAGGETGAGWRPESRRSSAGRRHLGIDGRFGRSINVHDLRTPHGLACYSFAAWSLAMCAINSSSSAHPVK